MLKRFFKILLGHLAYNLSPSKLRIMLNRVKGVSIGKNTFLGKHVTIDDNYSHLISIGSNCGIATGVILIAHRRNISNYSKEKGYNSYPFFVGSIIIKDNVQIGAGCIILPGITIGESSIIGAGSVVTKDVPPFSLAVGVPAKVIKTFD